MTNDKKLERAVDRAIADENARFLASDVEQREARELGDLYRRVYEAQERGFVQREGETLADFVERATTFVTNREQFEIEADRIAGEIHDLATRLGRNPHHVVDLVKRYVTIRRG
jgi:hypothetical protein